MISKLISWLKRYLRCNWQRGWYLQDYKDHGYNGTIERDGDDLLMTSNTHPDVTGYKARKCEIAREVRKPTRFEFDFTIYNFTKDELAYTIIQQFWEKPIAPVCYLTLQRKHGELRLYMQNKVPDNSELGFKVVTYHTFILAEDSRTTINMSFREDSFRVVCNGEDSGWKDTPFLNYNKCWIKAGMYWSWKQDETRDYKMTIHHAKVS